MKQHPQRLETVVDQPQEQEEEATPRRRGRGKEGKAGIAIPQGGMAFSQQVRITADAELSPEKREKALEWIQEYLTCNHVQTERFECHVLARIRGQGLEGNTALKTVTRTCYNIGRALGRTKAEPPYLHVELIGGSPQARKTRKEEHE